jgi:hypothetical protein
MSTRGAVLLHILVTTMMIFLFISLAIRLYLSRKVLEAKTEQMTRERHLAQGASDFILACLFDSSYPDLASCAPSPAHSACLPTSFKGLPLEAALSGSPPACILRVTIKP